MLPSAEPTTLCLSVSLQALLTQGGKDSKLWVTDLKRLKQWPSTPPKVGHRRDFYRLSRPDIDPVIVEKIFSKIEDRTAPILKTLDEDRRGPTQEELDALLFFVALQWTRVPSFRPKVAAIADRIHKSNMEKALADRESWARTLRNLGFSDDGPGSDYEEMREFVRSGSYSFVAETEWYLERAFQAAQTIVRSLKRKHWHTYVSETGNFIGSDNPVVIDGAKDELIGFKNADVVTYPVSRHVMLCGTLTPLALRSVTMKMIAEANTLTMLAVDEQLYSHAPSSCWSDEFGRVSYEWDSFSRDKILGSVRKPGRNNDREPTTGD